MPSLILCHGDILPALPLIIYSFRTLVTILYKVDGVNFETRGDSIGSFLLDTSSCQELTKFQVRTSHRYIIFLIGIEGMCFVISRFTNCVGVNLHPAWWVEEELFIDILVSVWLHNGAWPMVSQIFIIELTKIKIILLSERIGIFILISPVTLLWNNHHDQPLGHHWNLPHPYHQLHCWNRCLNMFANIWSQAEMFCRLLRKSRLYWCLQCKCKCCLH